jgi:uncharacterized protein
MSQRGLASPHSLLTTVFDTLEFSRTGGRFEGEVAVAQMGRLADLTGDGSGYLQCSVVGELGSEGQHYLMVRIAGRLRLRCQRCLQLLDWPIQVSSRLLLVPPSSAWPDEDLAADDSDAIAAEQAQALLPLLEDEAMLALPISPRHELCELPAAAEIGNEASPFAALAKLKKF